MIGGLLKKLVYLSVGLSIILGFIGVKLILHALHSYHLADWAPFDGEIPIWLSLTVIIVTLTITTVASLVKSKYDEDQLRRALRSPVKVRLQLWFPAHRWPARSPEQPALPHPCSERH